MANTIDPGQHKSTWSLTDTNVDSTINSNGTDFLSPSRVLIYARKTSDTSGVFSAIGVIQGWSFAEQRDIQEIYELGSDTKYLVPGRTTGQINIQRVLLSGRDLANVLYDSAADDGNTIRTLKDIAVPVDLIFVAYANTNNGAADERFRRYFQGCWMSARQESLAAGQAIVAESCTLAYKNLLVTAGTNSSAGT